MAENKNKAWRNINREYIYFGLATFNTHDKGRYHAVVTVKPAQHAPPSPGNKVSKVRLITLFKSDSNTQAQVIARRVGKILLDAEVPFGGLNRRMPERNLDLLESGMALVREFRKGSPEIVRR